MIHGYRVADPTRLLVADEPSESVDIRRPPVGGQPGDLSLVPLGLESAERRDIGVEVAQGVEAVDRAQALQSAPTSFVHASRQPIPTPIQRHDQCVSEAAGEIGAGGVTVVVIVEADRRCDAVIPPQQLRKLLPPLPEDEALQNMVCRPGQGEMADERGQRGPHAIESRGFERLFAVEPPQPGHGLRLEHADALRDRHMLDLLRRDTRQAKRALDGLAGHPRGHLLAAQPLFGHSGKYGPPIQYRRRRWFAVYYPEYEHRSRIGLNRLSEGHPPHRAEARSARLRTHDSFPVTE